MATNAKIIKLGNSTTTYIPITSTEAIQHSYGGEKVVLESYLGGLQADIAKNASNISILAGAVVQEKANLEALNAHVADYKASYIKAGKNANQIVYNLPNGTYGLITINNVANAVTATNLATDPVLNKTAATGNDADSFTVTAGGKTSGAVSLSKASATAYGVANQPYLAAAVRSGLTAGLPEQNTFGASEPITGAEAAVLLCNALDLEVDAQTMADPDSSVPAWAQTPLAALNSSGIVLEAETVMTRGETAQVLYQALQIAAEGEWGIKAR